MKGTATGGGACSTCGRVSSTVTIWSRWESSGCITADGWKPGSWYNASGSRLNSRATIPRISERTHRAARVMSLSTPRVGYDV